MDTAKLNRAYFQTGEWVRTTYQGRKLLKYPSDLFVYERIIAETNPDLIIETGTLEGGSAKWFKDHSSADVISIDTRKPAGLLPPGVTYVTGDSLDVKLNLRKYKRVMVVLDSDHSKAQVLAEIKKFAPLVSKGCYLVVEDTFISRYLDNQDGHNDYSAGSSWEAVQAWDKKGFASVDHSMVLSMNPGGWFKKL